MGQCMEKNKQLVRDIGKNELSHASIPFWSWNDRLEPEELRRQIRDMHDLKMRGFFMHARGGLETDYLSDDWYECVNACIDEAKKLGMEAWAYDENGWPSGFAGGKLLENRANWATYLTCQEYEQYPDGEHILGIYTIDGDNVSHRVSGPVPGISKYYAVLQNWDSSYVDTMDETITAQFITATHADYEKHVSAGEFGKTMPGFFTDEPQYFRYGTPWSETFRTRFESEYGYSVFDNLVALFREVKGYKTFRYDYHRLCHRSFIFGFAKPIYDWCSAHGVQLTGHAVEELDLQGQMMCCGDIMAFYLYEHIPGIDFLTRGRVGDAGFRQLGSVVAQRGVSHALSEMFACCGWDVSPQELKRIAEHQYVNGINLMCQHLYPYSIRGQRKRDYPCHYSEHLPWQKDMKEFDNYFNHLGYTLSLGKEDVHVLVIHPVHSAWLTYERQAHGASVRKLNSDFQDLSDTLSCNQIPFHWGSETVMEQLASVQGNRLVVGQMSYDYVIVPSMENIDRNTLNLLQTYMAQGGKLWLAGEKPTFVSGRECDVALESNTSLAEIMASVCVTCYGRRREWMRVMTRNTAEYGKIVYALNLKDGRIGDIYLNVRDVQGMAQLDMNTLTVRPVHGRILPDGSTDVYLRPDAVESFVLVESDVPMLQDLPERPGDGLKLNPEFRLTERPLNSLTIDRYAISKDGGKTFTESRPIECIRDNLLRERFAGEVTFRAAFMVETVPSGLKVALEPADYTDIRVNGQKITLNPEDWYLDHSFHTAEISGLVHTGENVLQFTLKYRQRDYVYYVLYGGVSESLRNCLSFDTEVEACYLTGDFCVRSETPFEKGPSSVDYALVTDGPFTITAAVDTVNAGNLVQHGYPFFAGRMQLEQKVEWHKGMPTRLNLHGRCPVVHVRVNGVPAESTLFTDSVDLKELLREGDNVIHLELVNSNRNLLGPHHDRDAEPLGVGPWTFSYENGWKGTECPAYFRRYAFVRFGFDS